MYQDRKQGNKSFQTALFAGLGVLVSSVAANAGLLSKSGYRLTALPVDQIEMLNTVPDAGQKKIKKVVDQNAQQQATTAAVAPKPVQVMEKINEDEIPKVAITELRLGQVRGQDGKSHDVTMKVTDGKVVQVMDNSGWKNVSDIGGNKLNVSGSIYSYSRGKLKRRYKVRYKSGRWTYRRCIKNKNCRAHYRRLAKKLKKVRYIPTRLRVKACMKNKKCRNKVSRIIRRHSKKSCYIPTRGKGRVCKVKRSAMR